MIGYLSFTQRTILHIARAFVLFNLIFFNMKNIKTMDGKMFEIDTQSMKSKLKMETKIKKIECPNRDELIIIIILLLFLICWRP